MFLNKNKCTCVIQIYLIPCFVLLASFFLIFVLLLVLGQEAQPPCLLGVFSFICLLFFLLFSYIVHMLKYQNQCYMCTKINVIQWLASSGRLVFRKKSCNLDVIPIMAWSSKNNMLGFWTQVLGIQVSHLRLIKGQHLLLLVMNLWSMKLS